MGKNDVEHETRIESSTERASHGSQGGYRGSPEMRTDAIRHHYVWDRGIPLGAIVGVVLQCLLTIVSHSSHGQRSFGDASAEFHGGL